MRTKFAVALFFALLLLSTTALAQDLDAKLAAIDAYAEKARIEWNIPGMAVAIVKDDKVVFAKGYGVQKLESSPAATYARLFFAVKAKNTNAIKWEMSRSTWKFAESVAERNRKPFEVVYSNGFSRTTFAANLPEMRNVRINSRFGAVEVFSTTENKWEDLPFVFEDGDWKLAIGELFSGEYEKPRDPLETTKIRQSNSNQNAATKGRLDSLTEPPLIDSNLVDENTLFAIASNSKAFTTASLAVLIDEKKIGGWDDKVSKYLPEFELYDPYVTSELTIRDLVSHRVGLGTFSGDLLWYESTYSTGEILTRLKLLKPTRGFRTGFGYQNLMFMAAGAIVEKVSGKRWGEFVKERFLTPLKMDRTTTSVKDIRDNAAWPHNESGGNGLRVLHRGNVDGAAAAAGLNSSVKDVANWLRMQIADGKFDGKQIVSEQNMWEMHQPAVILPVSKRSAELFESKHFDTYGLGWNVWDYRGRKVVSHGGGLDGMISRTAMMPEEKLGLVVLTNSENSVPTALQFKIFDVFTGKSDKDWSTVFKGLNDSGQRRGEDAWKKLQDERKGDTKPTISAEDFAGTYTGSMYGDAVVSNENGKLVLRLKPAPNFVADLEHWHYNTYRIRWRPSVAYHFPPGFVLFKIDEKGVADELVIDQPNNDFWFYELEFKRKID